MKNVVVFAATLLVVCGCFLCGCGTQPPSILGGKDGAKKQGAEKDDAFVDQCARIDAALAVGVTPEEFRRMFIELVALQRRATMDDRKVVQIVSDYESVLWFLNVERQYKNQLGECVLHLSENGGIAERVVDGEWSGAEAWRVQQQALRRIVQPRRYLIRGRERAKDLSTGDYLKAFDYFIFKDAPLLIAVEAKKLWANE